MKLIGLKVLLESKLSLKSLQKHKNQVVQFI